MSRDVLCGRGKVDFLLSFVALFSPAFVLLLVVVISLALGDWAPASVEEVSQASDCVKEKTRSRLDVVKSNPQHEKVPVTKGELRAYTVDCERADPLQDL